MSHVNVIVVVVSIDVYSILVSVAIISVQGSHSMFVCLCRSSSSFLFGVSGQRHADIAVLHTASKRYLSCCRVSAHR